jgi:hypothetical protein
MKLSKKGTYRTGTEGRKWALTPKALKRSLGQEEITENHLAETPDDLILPTQHQS